MFEMLSRYAPPAGTRLLLALLCGLTVASALITEGGVPTMVLTVVGDFNPIALVTNGLVAAPTGPFGLVFLLLIFGYFNQHLLRAMWQRQPQQMLAVGVGSLLALVVLDRLLKGFGFGLATDALFLLWTAGVVERAWGRRRLLWFVAVVGVVTNAVAAGLLWLWPGSLRALAGPGGAVPIGVGPVSYGLITVWCLMQGERLLAMINAPARKLIIAVAILKGLDVIFVGVAVGICGLTGIGMAVLLTSGRWDPRRWSRRPKAPKRPDLRVLRDDERNLHWSESTRRAKPLWASFVHASWAVLFCADRVNARPNESRETRGEAMRGKVSPVVRMIKTCVCAVLLLAAPAALAGPPPEAAQAYEAGVVHFKAKRYADAIAEFNKAYRIAPNPVLVFNMARAFEELKEYDSAVEFYQRYLDMQPEATDRAAVEDAIRTLELLSKREKAPEVGQIVVQSTPDGALVFVDGRQVGRTPLKTEVTAGAHFVSIEKEGFSRATKELNIAGGAEIKHSATLVPLAVATPAVQGESNLGGWLMVGIGSAMVIGGGIMGVLALDQETQLEKIESGERDATRAEFNDIQDTGRLYAYLADGLMLGGAAAALTGGIVLLTSDDESTAQGPGPVGVRF